MRCRLWRKVLSAAQPFVVLLAVAGAPTEAGAFPRHPGPLTEGRSLGSITEQAFPKWHGVMGRSWAYVPAMDEVCGARVVGRCGLQDWHGFLAALERLDPRSRLRRVNAYVNRVPYRPDSAVWSRSDYWAAPGEFFARGGDCEDYAVAKYFSLRILGFPPEALRIVVLNDRLRRVAHAVLVVRQGDREWILDNLTDRLIDWREQDRYRPVYAVNEDRAWAPMPRASEG